MHRSAPRTPAAQPRFGWGGVAAICAAAIGAPALGCGAATGATTAAREPLGVQSNASTAPVRLRLAPRGPATFATELHVTLSSELLGEPLRAEIETRGVRRVVEVRPDGGIVIEEQDTSSRYAITMMGNTEAGPRTQDAPRAPRRYVLGERGRALETPPTPTPPTSPGAPPPPTSPGTPTPPTSPGTGMADVVQDRLGSALEPMVRALDFPERAVSIGDEWGADGRIPFADVDPSMQGEAVYRLTQRLDRFEGTGEDRMAIIAFEGTLEGAGRGRSGPMPTDAGLAGRLEVRGFYAVALADGFTRTARAQVTGEARLGPEELMRFPIQGEIRWDAAAIPTQSR